MFKFIIACLMVLTFNYANAGLDDFAVIDSSGNVKLKTATIVKALQSGSTCVMYRASVRFHSKNVTKKQCRDKDFRERNKIRVIKCRDIADNDLSAQCKGLK